ncbi:MAG: hypothetical protein ACYDA9_02910 [Terriglobia bacterium]
MSIYATQPLKLDHIKTYPLKSRPSKVTIADFDRVPRSGASLKQWVTSLPRILAGETFRAVVEAIEHARLCPSPFHKFKLPMAR